jgi:hypothetical protein
LRNLPLGFIQQRDFDAPVLVASLPGFVVGDGVFLA